MSLTEGRTPVGHSSVELVGVLSRTKRPVGIRAHIDAPTQLVVGYASWVHGSAIIYQTLVMTLDH